MKKISLLLPFLIFAAQLSSQPQRYTIKLLPLPSERRVVVNVNDDSFTEFIYPDSLEKPVLFPVYAPDQQIITRGFPIQPRPGEPTDHPHHTGIWFNYENVNGLDFWNNSYAVPAEKRHLYGWIRLTKILLIKSGKRGILRYKADWVDHNKRVLLTETTTFIFSAGKEKRMIDRITTFSAKEDLLFADAKDGLLGLRVTHELELPSAQPKKYEDNKGNITAVTADTLPTGNYLTSEGRTGDSAWATRAVWCLLFGEKMGDTISISIIDHPLNPGYPTYWHARGYGLFAANPLGQKIFSNGKQVLDFHLNKSKEVTFRYRIVITAGKERIKSTTLDQLAKEFAKINSH
jgi:hypothetical protein